MEQVLENFLHELDNLLDAAIRGETTVAEPLTNRELYGWLDDIIYTAEELQRELLQAKVK